jgi:PIN domain nuclease of toxin-antitoxin system
MITLLLDTHAVIWLLHKDKRLSISALDAINAVYQKEQQIAVASISLIEVAYLEEKGRLPSNTLSGILQLMDQAQPLLAEVPLNRSIVQGNRV